MNTQDKITEIINLLNNNGYTIKEDNAYINPTIGRFIFYENHIGAENCVKMQGSFNLEDDNCVDKIKDYIKGARHWSMPDYPNLGKNTQRLLEIARLQDELYSMGLTNKHQYSNEGRIDEMHYAAKGKYKFYGDFQVKFFADFIEIKYQSCRPCFTIEYRRDFHKIIINKVKEMINADSR